MFSGHYGVGFALKRSERALSLGVLFLAVQFTDILWSLLVLSGVERVAVVPGVSAANPLDFLYYPFSHSLLASLVWAGIVFALFAFLPHRFRGNKMVGGVVLGVAVLSHFFLDLLVHIPDLPLGLGDSTKIGLGLWNNVWLSLVAEWLILLAGFWIYLRSTKAKSFVGKYGPWLLAVLLFFAPLLNMTGTPPNNPRIIAISALAMYVTLAFLALWVDRKRIPAAFKVIEVGSRKWAAKHLQPAKRK